MTQLCAGNMPDKADGAPLRELESRTAAQQVPERPARRRLAGQCGILRHSRVLQKLGRHSNAFRGKHTPVSLERSI